MEHTVGHTVALLAIAILVAILARRLRLPYTVGLVATGIALAIGGIDTGLVLTHELVFDVILPPLLFEAAFALRWQELRADGPPILVLAVVGTVVAAAIIGLAMYWGLGWPIRAAALFGALIAATDPVAVIAMFKDTGVHGRIRLLVESESLLNDGVAAVLFGLLLMPVGPIATAWMALGGIVVGLAVGFAVSFVAGQTEERMVEAALTVAAAYGSFVLAERLGASGVLATVTAGLLLGNRKPLSDEGHRFAEDVWEFAAFVANSVIFILIGAALARIPFGVLGWGGLIWTLAVVLAVRAATVYPLCALFGGSRWRVPMGQQHVLWWGGLRGALGLALVLTLDATEPLRDAVVVATFATVAFSVLVQGLTMGPLLRRVGVV